MKQCQSCGMPLSKDPNGGGTESDGSKSETYCSFCYEAGSFRQPDFSAKEMQTFCIDMMKKQGMLGPIAWLFTRQIPNLKRWKA